MSVAGLSQPFPASICGHWYRSAAGVETLGDASAAASELEQC